MAGRTDIKAGSAYVELLLKKNAFVQGLNESSRRLKSFGGGIAVIGASITAAGAAIRGSLLAAVYKFAEGGDKLAKMSQRTGVSAKALSELGFAAEQSGQDIDTLETSLKRMQKTVGAALEGNGEAAKSFGMIGLGLDQLQGKSPDKQFEAIADALSKVHDPTMRAAHAMAIFGRSGTDLLPMMLKGAKGIQALRQEAQDLGLSKSEGDVKLAEKLTDSFNKMHRVATGVVSKIGSALAPSVLTAVTNITKIGTAVGNWVKQNKSLFVTLSGVATGLLVVGSAVTAVGTTIAFMGIALGGVTSAMAAIASLGSISLAAILSPLALIAAALALGVAGWLKFSGTGKTALGTFTSGLGKLLAFVRETFGAISDAIQGGDLTLAADIAMAALNVAWVAGINALRSAWNGLSNSLGLDGAFADIRSAWEDLQLFLASSFIDLEVDFADAITSMSIGWSKFLRGAQSLWTLYQAGVKASWVEIIGRINGDDERVRQIGIRAIRSDLLKELDEIDAKAKSEQDKLAADAPGRKKQLQQNQRGAHQALEDDFNRKRRRASGGGPDTSAADRAASERLAKAQTDLEALKGRAKDAKYFADKRQAERDAALAGADKGGEGAELGKEVLGSFNAAALAAGGASSAPIERVAKAAEKQVALTAEQKALQAKQNKILSDSLEQLKLAGKYK